MRRSAAALLFVSLVTLTNRDAAAQPSAQDVAGALGIMGTPAGTFTPVILNSGWDAKGKFGLAGRYGMNSPKVGDANNSIGVTGSMGAGSNAIVSGTLGYTMVGCPSGATCDNGIQVGGDILSSLWSSKTDVITRPTIPKPPIQWSATTANSNTAKTPTIHIASAAPRSTSRTCRLVRLSWR